MITSAAAAAAGLQTHVAENLHFLSPVPLTALSARHSSHAHTCHFILKTPFPFPAPPTATIAVAHTGTWTLGHASRILEKRANLHTIFMKIFIYFSSLIPLVDQEMILFMMVFQDFSVLMMRSLKTDSSAFSESLSPCSPCRVGIIPENFSRKTGSIVLQLASHHRSCVQAAPPCPGSPRVEAPPRVSP